MSSKIPGLYNIPTKIHEPSCKLLTEQLPQLFWIRDIRIVPLNPLQSPNSMKDKKKRRNPIINNYRTVSCWPQLARPSVEFSSTDCHCTLQTGSVQHHSEGSGQATYRWCDFHCSTCQGRGSLNFYVGFTYLKKAFGTVTWTFKPSGCPRIFLWIL